ncbi:alpha/beta fold hydrolase [Aestuariivirga sp.]|uniref:alpha/beta fold hydrolase n=1 Tax=Aestuariivirga sp. TaxID=2650926 RepID=UPI003BAD2C6C
MILHPTPENPLPPGAECVELVTKDKVSLRAMRAMPPGEARGTFVILGGRGDYLERYFETTRDLMARGFAVAGVDLRGQGGSGRPASDPYRDRLESFDGFDEDVRTLMEGMVLTSCPAPYFALGHSTGAHVWLRVLQANHWFSAAVLVSPLVDVIYGAWPRSLVALLVNGAALARRGSWFLPGVRKKPMGRSDFAGNPLTSDRRRWNRDSSTLEVAPHLGLGGPTFGWLKAARRSLKGVARMKRPLASVLIVAAGNDQVVSNEGTRRLARKMPGVALTFIPDAQHEILGERDEVRRQFFAALDSFISP